MTKKKIEYLKCPVCGMTKPRRFFAGRDEVRFDDVDVKTVMVWQLKEAGGYKSGFHIIDSKTLGELPHGLKDQLRGQCERILEEIGE